MQGCSTSTVTDADDRGRDRRFAGRAKRWVGSLRPPASRLAVMFYLASSSGMVFSCVGTGAWLRKLGDAEMDRCIGRLLLGRPVFNGMWEGTG